MYIGAFKGPSVAWQQLILDPEARSRSPKPCDPKPDLLLHLNSLCHIYLCVCIHRGMYIHTYRDILYKHIYIYMAVSHLVSSKGI